MAISLTLPEKFSTSIHRDEVVIDGINLSNWIPDYYQYSSYTSPQNATTYYLRSNSGQTMFIKTLHLALYNFMLQLGYEPNETFEFVSINTRKVKREGVYRSNFFNRLEILERRVCYDKIHTGMAKIVHARFYDNDPQLDYGFSVEISSRTFVLRLRPNIPLSNLKKNITPEEFAHKFFTSIQYPYYLYVFQLENRTLHRLVKENHDLQNKVHKFERYAFPA